MERYKKNELTLQALEILGHSALGAVDFFDRMLMGKYLSKEQYKRLMRRREKRHNELNTSIEEMRERQNFYSLLNYLQKSGLIKKKKINDKTIWITTKEGLLKKKILLEKRKENFSLPSATYKTEPSKSLVIVIFDIPEQEKNKRVWLRSVLRNLDFKLLQKSVWLGNNELPIEFLEDLRKLNLLSYVKIFSALERGNI